MKKLVAAVLTGVLVAGTLSTGVYAKDDDKTITVAASATPHAEILEEAKPLLEKEGYELEVTVFDDYVRPNEVVESGEFDANYFQHIPYLDQFNEEKGTHLVNAGGIHYEPFGIYPGTKDSLDDLEDGDSIAVPNDTTNEARALLLLQDNGIITLKDGAGLNATVKDIAENPHNVEIVELEAAQVARVTGETAYVVLNGNYALEAGFSDLQQSRSVLFPVNKLLPEVPLRAIRSYLMPVLKEQLPMHSVHVRPENNLPSCLFFSYKPHQ